MKQYHYFLATFLIICSYSLNSFSQATPNFIFILTDDQSYGYMGCTGNTIVQTPHLDQLAREGILFTKAYVTSAICTPSRVSILLSQYERKHGVNFNSGTSVSEEAWKQSYPVIMREHGYYTGWIGKNHAPIGPEGYEGDLMEKSFDYWYAGHGHLTFYPKERHEIFKGAQADTQVEIMEEGVNDFLDPNEAKLEGALRFLDQRPANQPFMLSICFNLPHSAGTRSMKQKPNDDEIYKSLYRDVEIPLPPNYVAKAAIQEPKLPADLLKVENRQTSYDYVDTPETMREIYIRQLQAMTGIDRLVGNLRAKLDELNLDTNTVLIFTSDHGLFMGEYGLGGKALCYEKVTHVPLIVYDPQVSPEAKGQISDALVQSIDIAPMLLSRAGIPIPATFQGKDIYPLVRGGGTPVREYIYTENLWSTHFGNPRCEAIQDKEWKYIRYYENNTIAAQKKIQVAKELGLPVNKLLYGIHDSDIAVYRHYIEASLQGEEPVYEELYHLEADPLEQYNLVHEDKHIPTLLRLRAAWEIVIAKARGQGKPKVKRYTVDSKLEQLQK